MLLAFAGFFIGSLLILKPEDAVFFGFTIVFLSLSKIFLCLKFSHNKDFNISKLVPIAIVMFVYAVMLIGFLYTSLKRFLFPGLGSFFVTLLMVQFAYLRQFVFNKKSYRFVFFGVLTYAVSEGMVAIKVFRDFLPFQDFLIMFSYGLALYLIIYGILSESEKELQELNALEKQSGLS